MEQLSVDATRRLKNRHAMEAFMSAVGTGDFALLETLCQPDFVVELPYSDPPQRLEGFPAYRAAVAPSLEVFQFSLTLSAVHPCLDPDLLIAEYTSDGIATTTGKVYRNVYIGVWGFREGRIASLREFFNPVRATEALRPE
jgi:ketosteroid isomerase-like protein